METERRLEDIRVMLLRDGINYALVMKMTDNELRKADSYEDYDEYDKFMLCMAHEYDI